MEMVDLTNFFSWTILLHLVRPLVIFNISNAILKRKHSLYITFFTLISVSLFYSYLTLLVATEIPEILFIVVYCVLAFILLCLLYNGSFFAKLFTTIFSLVAYQTAAYFSSLIIKYTFNSDISIGTSFMISRNQLLTACLCIFSFSFIFIIIINFVKSKTNPSFKYKAKYSFYYLFPLTHIFSSELIDISIKIATPEGFAQKAQSDPFLENGIVFLIVVCLIFDVFIIFVVDRQSKIEEKNIQNEKELLKSELDYNQMQLLKKEKSEFSKVKHDLINLLTTATGFIEMGKTEKALEIIRKTSSSFSEISGVPLCANETLNTILYIKQQKAEEMGVTLKTNVNENAFLKPDDYDLCRLLHNIIDNSINASSALSENNVSEITIDIDDDFLSITSKNPYPETTKRTKERNEDHGHGINIIKDIAKKYSGTYFAEKSGGMYITVTKLRNISKS